MTHPPSFHPSRRRCLLALTASVLAPAVRAGSSPETWDDVMPNGTWTIASKRPDRPGTPDVNYLPPGTRIRLHFQGLTDFADENGLTNEFAVSVEVFGPITPEQCRTGIGKFTTFGGAICGPDGRPLDAVDGAPFEFDAIAVMGRVEGTAASMLNDIFPMSQGAKVGAPVMTIGFKYKGLAWDLWIKSSDEMVQEVGWLGETPDGDGLVPMIWRRE